MKSWWKKLGPGLITGASDDDPSGITTYSLSGAQAGYRLLWMSLYTIPLMAAVQEMCARIGLVNGVGLAGTIRKHYDRFLLIPVAVLLIGANTLNVGADLHGMSSAAALVLPLPEWLLSALFAAAIVLLMVYYPYWKIARVLKWLTLSLLTYIAAAFVTHQDWVSILWSTLIPRFGALKDDAMIAVAVLGTTISPYLFFWMASEEVEERRHQEANGGFSIDEASLKEMRADVTIGMVFSNLIMLFIMATCASVFFGHDLSIESSVADIASALRPLAGNAAFLLFATGVVGTGFLAIPVLAGSSAYALAESFDVHSSLSAKMRDARVFYWTIIFSGVIGFLISLLPFSPVFLLFATSIVYGVTSPIMIAVIMHIANNKKIMGSHVNRPIDNLFGGLAFLVMVAAVLVLAWTTFL